MIKLHEDYYLHFFTIWSSSKHSLLFSTTLMCFISLQFLSHWESHFWSKWEFKWESQSIKVFIMVINVVKHPIYLDLWPKAFQ